MTFLRVVLYWAQPGALGAMQKVRGSSPRSSIMNQMLENAKPEPSDPVHFHEDKWWFWDEVWANRMGPFETEEEVRKEIVRYCKEVLGHETDS